MAKKVNFNSSELDNLIKNLYTINVTLLKRGQFHGKEN